MAKPRITYLFGAGKMKISADKIIIEADDVRQFIIPNEYFE
jgi:hypothetical protein